MGIRRNHRYGTVPAHMRVHHSSARTEDTIVGEAHAQSAIVVNTSCGQVRSGACVQLPTPTGHSPNQVHGGSVTAWAVTSPQCASSGPPNNHCRPFSTVV